VNADERVTTSAANPLRLAVGAFMAMCIGAIAGVVLAFAFPAHVEIAGSHARVWLEPGHDYDEFSVPGLVSLKRVTTRQIVGEPIGVQIAVDLDVSQLVGREGQFNPGVLPAYIQAYSDPRQMISDLRRALITHLLWFMGGGAAVGLGLLGGVHGYRRWRRAHDLHRWAPGERAIALAYHAPERRLLRRAALGVALVGVVAAVPSGQMHLHGRTVIVGDAIFAGGPLAGTEVDGLLRPALAAAETYIKTYTTETDAYYAALRDRLVRQLDQVPVALPQGEDVVQFGFVTDRHCNTGMDRVDVALLHHLGVKTLVSGGDDAFSGSFSFESACTRTLAERSRSAGITDVFVGGNHDSPATLAAEKKQKIKTLMGSPVSVDGLTFLGSPDPRTSRYGQGIEPSSNRAQRALVTAQGSAAGKTACGLTAPIIAVLHDPLAGLRALHDGCGHVTLALDGHTHTQSGPDASALANGLVGFRFVGGSAGGAPSEHSIEKTFAARLTVGPLNHDAYVYVISVSRSSGALAGVTTFRFTPDQAIVVTQQVLG